MLLIGSLGAMWAWWGKQFHEPKCGSGYVCRVMAWTRHPGLVPYIGFEKVRRDLFSVFWLILIVPTFVWSPLVLLFPSLPVSISILLWLYWMHQMRLVLPSLSCSIVFSVLQLGLGTYLSFRFLSVLPWDQLELQNSLFGRFPFFCWLSLGLVVRPILDDPTVSQNPREVYASHFLGRILGCAYTIYSYGQI